MTKADKLLLEVYKAIGTPDEIITRLDSPYPDADEGYAPLPLSDHRKSSGNAKCIPGKTQTRGDEDTPT